MRLTTPKTWLLSLLLLPGMAWAQTDGPIALSADSAEVNEAEGVSLYRGNVVLTRGDMRITGDLMRVFTDTERQLQRIEVEGTPATWQQTLPEADPRQAEAPRMDYYASGPERVILREGGRLWQGDNTVSGTTITHYPAEARTVAEGEGGDDGRVSATVYPEGEGAQ